MVAERLVKWSKEAQEFFEKAEDNSVVLDLVISYSCASQTGEGFEDLINSINREEIKKKVKKVNITDTAYLYRHCISDCLRYVDKKVSTLWYINNKLFIDNLNVEVNLKPWVDGISTDTFKQWHKQILLDYNGDEKGKGIDREFRELIISEASVAAYKGDIHFQQCVDFILEENAYVCANLKNSVILYPMPFYGSINYVITKYKLNLLHLYYTVSRYARRKSRNIEGLKIERDVFPFLVETLNANFFIIDRNGNYIYKNNKLSNIVGDIPANIVAPEVWSVSMDIMKTNKQKVVEELYNGRYYLSVKAPLIVNDSVEGVMGVSIDITDRKRAEELEKKSAIEKELYEIAKRVAHDICSPISALDMVKYVCNDKLSQKESKMFELAIRSIKDISDRLIKKYRNLEKGVEEEPETKEDKYIAPYTIRDVIENKKYQDQGKNDIDINFNPDEDNKFVFIRGNYTDFSRMMSNLINNGVDAIGKKGGRLEVSYKVKGEEVEIVVKDNGNGMPGGMVEKINRGMAVGTTKENGHGIGMEQILKTVRELEGKVEVKSKEGEGTEFILKFLKCENPKWFADKIEIKKGSTVVVLDDDIETHEMWKKKFKRYEKEIEVKYFTKVMEAIDYLNSMEDKDKVLLLTEYEIKGERINGVEVIEKTKTQDKHILVTNKYLSDIEEFKEKNGFLKICHKMYINDIPFAVV